MLEVVETLDVRGQYVLEPCCCMLVWDRRQVLAIPAACCAMASVREDKGPLGAVHAALQHGTVSHYHERRHSAVLQDVDAGEDTEPLCSPI